MTDNTVTPGPDAVNPHEEFTKNWLVFELNCSNKRAKAALPAWREKFPDEIIDLRGVDLRRSKLSEAYLFNTDLRGANLRGADLSEADLRGATLNGADLRGANLRGADLREAYLFNTDLRGANLRGADLSQADLHGAYLDGADLCEADLSEVNGLEPQQLLDTKNLEVVKNIDPTLLAAAIALQNAAELAAQRRMLKAIMTHLGISLPGDS
jgi:hypothetical protein